MLGVPEEPFLFLSSLSVSLLVPVSLDDDDVEFPSTPSKDTGTSKETDKEDRKRKGPSDIPITVNSGKHIIPNCPKVDLFLSEKVNMLKYQRLRLQLKDIRDENHTLNDALLKAFETQHNIPTDANVNYVQFVNARIESLTRSIAENEANSTLFQSEHK